MAEPFAATLTASAEVRGVALSPAIVAGCAEHYRNLIKWNETHNLTRVTAPAEAATKHYLDCLVPLLGRPAPAAFIDVGSGAGFPGLVAALLWPEAHATLVEPAKKRQSFLKVAAAALGRSVTVTAPERATALTGPLVMSRATFSAGERGALWGYVAPGGTLLVWSTAAERSAWQTEVATWPGATLTSRPYQVDDVAREVVSVSRVL